MHRRGAGVIALALYRDFLPRDALYARDGTDANGVHFEERPLFDVEFHEGVRNVAWTRSGTQVSNAFQLVTQSHTVDTDHVVSGLHRHSARVDE